MHSAPTILFLLALGAASSPLPSIRTPGGLADDPGPGFAPPTHDLPAPVSRVPSRIYSRTLANHDSKVDTESLTHHESRDSDNAAANVVLHGTSRGRRSSGVKRGLLDFNLDTAPLTNSPSDTSHTNQARRDPLSGPLALADARVNRTARADRGLDAFILNIDPHPILGVRSPLPDSNVLENISNGNSYSGAAGNAAGGSVLPAIPPSSKAPGGLLGSANGGSLVSLFSGNAGDGGSASTGAAGGRPGFGGLGSLSSSKGTGRYPGGIPSAPSIIKKVTKNKDGSTTTTINENLGNAFSGAAGNAAGGNVVGGGSLIDLFSHNAGNAGQANSGLSRALGKRTQERRYPRSGISRLDPPSLGDEKDFERVPSHLAPATLEPRTPAPQVGHTNPINPYPMVNDSVTSSVSPSPTSTQDRKRMQGKSRRSSNGKVKKRDISYGTRPRPDLSKMKMRVRYESDWRRQIRESLERSQAVSGFDNKANYPPDNRGSVSTLSILGGCWEWVKGFVEVMRGRKYWMPLADSQANANSNSFHGDTGRTKSDENSLSSYFPWVFPFYHRPGAAPILKSESQVLRVLGQDSASEITTLPVPGPPTPSVSAVDNGCDDNSSPPRSPHAFPSAPVLAATIGPDLATSHKLDTTHEPAILGNHDHSLSWLSRPSSSGSSSSSTNPPCACWNVWACTCSTGSMAADVSGPLRKWFRFGAVLGPVDPQALRDTPTGDILSTNSPATASFSAQMSSARMRLANNAKVILPTKDTPLYGWSENLKNLFGLTRV